MLPHSYNAGYSSNIRGFKKKNRLLRTYQQYAPYIAAGELILILIVGLWLSSSIQHEKRIVQRLEASHKSKELELRNLANSLDQERRSRQSAENGLRDSHSQLSGARRELQEMTTSHGLKEQHSQSLQESFDRTRVALETERDTARRELEESKNRVQNLEAQISHKDNTIDAHKIVAARKEELHTSKEKQWETMRAQLEEQLKKQGGFIPQNAAGSANHPDYAGKEGEGTFHFTSDGHKERFIDTAKDLAAIGVVDPKGIEHLAQLMGHLVDIKQAEYLAIQRAYPASEPPPKPPVGHWMALNLERMGISIPHGVMHLSYILDAHFALGNSLDAVGRGKGETVQQTGQATDTASNNTSQAGNRDPIGNQQPPSPPTHSDPVPGTHSADYLAEHGQQHDPSSTDPLAGRRRGRKGHRVDAAGFI